MQDIQKELEEAKESKEPRESKELKELREDIFQHENSIRNYIYIFLKNRLGRYPTFEEVESILSWTLTKAYQKIGQFRYGDLGSWLGGIAKNNCIDYLRDFKRNPDKTLVPYWKSFDVMSEELIERMLSSRLPPWHDKRGIKKRKKIEELKLLLCEMTDEFEGMTEKRKAVVRLRVHYNKSHKEIAKELGLGVEASKSLYCRAVKQLREFYDKYQERQKQVENIK